jgi:hypothetical protein
MRNSVTCHKVAFFYALNKWYKCVTITCKTTIQNFFEWFFMYQEKGEVSSKNNPTFSTQKLALPDWNARPLAVG